MEEILNEINAVVGVEGSFLCNEEGKILCSLMPESYEPGRIAAVGRILSQTMSGLSLARRRKVYEFDLAFDQLRLVAKNTNQGCLCIIGSPDINVHFLNMTADLAVKKIKDLPHVGQSGGRDQILPGLPEAVRTLVEFVNRLLQGAEEQGVNRTDLTKILDYRLKKFGTQNPLLKDLAGKDGRLDAGGVSFDEVARDEARDGIALLVHGVYLSLHGIMGEKKAEALYQGVFDPFFTAHTPSFTSLDMGDTLKTIPDRDTQSTHAGVDISLD